MATVKKEKETEIVIRTVERGRLNFCVLGTSPLIMNRLSQKAWFELLAPKGRKTMAEKQSSLKHDPVKEYRDSPYRMPNADAPTLLAVMPTAFKKAMATAALDTEGARKAQIGRLVYVPGEYLPVYGVPKVLMAITRSADAQRTPDVRTRAILPEWACYLTVIFAKPMLREQSIINLLSAAGFQSGVGDWRQEKGSGSYGSFELVSEDNPAFQRIVSTQGRVAQQEGLDDPAPYNSETSEILAWFGPEMARRGFKVAA